jgi:hypothetical protein
VQGEVDVGDEHTSAACERQMSQIDQGVKARQEAGSGRGRD